MIAWAALILWPVVSVIFYRKFSLPVALCATLIGGYMLLPSGIGYDPPVLPPLNKGTIPTITALVLTAIAIGQGRLRYPVLSGWVPRDPVTLGLMAMLVIGTFATVQTNRDVLVYGDRVLQAMRPYDAFSILLDFLMVLAPLFLARRVLSSPEGHRILLVALVASAVAYSFPALYEVRMSPQLHIKVYGYFPHQFAQAMRGDGFRPLVFLNHGLALGIFLTFAIIAAAGLVRATRDPTRWKWAMAMAWLFFTLVLAKSLGALLITLVLLPVVLFLRLRLQLMAGACIAGLIITFPMLRAADLIPVDQVLAFAEDISPARAASLNTRLENEEMLLEKARERQLFGWGIWGRNRVFDEQGRNISVTDGSWIIELGHGGWFRYIPIFGLLCWPVIGLFLTRRDKIDPLCAALALIICAKLIDLIPNSGYPEVVFLAAGALIGRLEMKSVAAVGEPAPSEPTRQADYARGAALPETGGRAPALRYARDFSGKKEDAAAASSDGRSGRGSRRGNPHTRPKPSLGYRR